MSYLFNPIVDYEKLNTSFKAVVESNGHEPGRIMMDEIFSKFHDVDGNFLEQFQTTGFDQRTFELYLYAYLDDAGFSISRKFERPDFIIEKDEYRIAIEATTAAPSDKIAEKDILYLSEDELLELQSNEIPIRLGSPLFSKLIKKYWELEQCKDIPFIIAIEAFYGHNSLLFSSSSLGKYLFGLDHKPNFDEHGKLSIDLIKIKEHKIPGKDIPSGFFNQPDSENVSAIIFTNAGTFTKFDRMGYYNGYYSNHINMRRFGTCYDYNPDAIFPKTFSYEISDTLHSPFRETWGQGMEIFYNPNAKIQLKRGILPNVAEHYIQDGKYYTNIPKPFHPYTSITHITALNTEFYYNKDKYMKITLAEFDKLLLAPERKMSPVKEICWMKSLDERVIMCIVQCLIDDDYGYAVYNKKNFIYDLIDARIGYSIIDECAKGMICVADQKYN